VRLSDRENPLSRLLWREISALADSDNKSVNYDKRELTLGATLHPRKQITRSHHMFVVEKIDLPKLGVRGLEADLSEEESEGTVTLFI
jgi:hypothetical protein